MLDTTDDSVRSAVAHRRAGPRAAVLGRARDRGRPRRGLPAPRHPRAVQAPLGRPRREGRGVAASCVDEDFRPRLERMWREQTYLHPRALLGYFPCYSRGQRDRRARPRGPRDRARAPRTARASPRATASAWPTSSARRTAGELDVVALQAVTVGDEVTELMAKLEADGEFAEQLFVARPRRADRRGPGRVAALAASATTSASPPRQGRRYSWGYPAVPEQSEHEKVDELLEPRADRHATLRRLRGRARAVDARARSPTTRRPVYFGMRNGRLLPGRLARRRDQGLRRATRRCSASSATRTRPSPARASRRPPPR